MTRLPAVTPKKLVAILLRKGFLVRRQRGSHLRLFNPVTNRQTVVPIHPGTLPRGLLNAILKRAGISDHEFQQLC